MNSKQKGQMISAMMLVIHDAIVRKNKAHLASLGCPADQIAFDAGEWFFKLAFMPDDKFAELAGKIL